MALKKLQVAAILFCMLSFAEAGTVSIGTASAYGDIRVDDSIVKGNATLFDGSVVETVKATANLRINKGTEITMAAGSRGTLYSDHIVLQQGETELVAPQSFQLHAAGIRVRSNEPGSRAVVAVRPDKTVEVASLNGSFGITNDQGITLANVVPGSSISFAMQAGTNNQDFAGSGHVSFKNNTYYLTTGAHAKYVLTCQSPASFVGYKVDVTGKLEVTNGETVLCLSKITQSLSPGISTTGKWIIGGVVVAALAGTAIGVSRLSGQIKSPASR
jgi:hypothetical protein